MSHFVYQHSPAKGLGNRDPRRPYVTGGIGGGISVFVGEAIPARTYEGDRVLEALLREGELVRAYAPTIRDGESTRTYTRSGRTGSADRTYEGTRTLSPPSRDYSGDRTYDEEERDGP
jgi:hypothetical protein